MVNVGEHQWPSWHGLANFAFTNVLVDAADEVAAQAFRVPKAGNIVRAHFRTGTVTTGGTNDLDIRLETLNSSVQPSGSLWATNTNINFDLLDTHDSTWHRTSPFTASATVAVGDLIALVIANPATNFGNFNVSAMSAYHVHRLSFPHAFGPARTTKIISAYLASALEYDDGTFLCPKGCLPVHATGSVSLNTGTNPDEVGLIFTPQFKMRVCGWWANHMTITAASGDYRVNLYEVGNNTPILSTDYDGDGTSIVNNDYSWDEYFDDVATLNAGTQYRLALVPLTATTITLPYFEVNSSYLGLWDQFSGKQAAHYTSRNRSGTSDPDSAAWTELTYRRPRFGLTYDQIDDGAGSGGSGGGLKLAGTGGLAG